MCFLVRRLLKGPPLSFEFLEGGMSTGQAMLSSSMTGSPEAGFQTSTDLADETMGSNGVRQFIILITAGNRSSMLSLVPLARQVPSG